MGRQEELQNPKQDPHPGSSEAGEGVGGRGRSQSQGVHWTGASKVFVTWVLRGGTSWMRDLSWWGRAVFGPKWLLLGLL